MTTRRAKLVQVLDLAAAQGMDAADLADHSREWKARGNAGIVEYLDFALQDLAPVEPTPSVDVASLEAIKAQLATLTSAVDAAIANA